MSETRNIYGVSSELIIRKCLFRLARQLDGKSRVIFNQGMVEDRLTITHRLSHGGSVWGFVLWIKLRSILKTEVGGGSTLPIPARNVNV